MRKFWIGLLVIPFIFQTNTGIAVEKYNKYEVYPDNLTIENMIPDDSALLASSGINSNNGYNPHYRNNVTTSTNNSTGFNFTNPGGVNVVQHGRPNNNYYNNNYRNNTTVKYDNKGNKIGYYKTNAVGKVTEYDEDGKKVGSFWADSGNNRIHSNNYSNYNTYGSPLDNFLNNITQYNSSGTTNSYWVTPTTTRYDRWGNVIQQY